MIKIEKDLSERCTFESLFSVLQNVGEEIGKRLKEKNIDTVVFDRNGYLYHGVVKAVADGARKTGIKF